MPTSEALNQIITKKLEKLERKFNWIIKAEVFIKKEKSDAGNLKICEIELSAPGPRIFASTKTDDYEKAVAGTIKDVERQLEKRKHTFASH
jgi:putative sigma-54 modulation protein